MLKELKLLLAEIKRQEYAKDEHQLRNMAQIWVGSESFVENWKIQQLYEQSFEAIWLILAKSYPEDGLKRVLTEDFPNAIVLWPEQFFAILTQFAINALLKALAKGEISWE